MGTTLDKPLHYVTSTLILVRMSLCFILIYAPDMSPSKTLLTALKKRLHSAKGKYVDELLGILWAYRITRRKSTRVSLFTLTIGMEAIIPTKIGVPTLQTETPKKSNTEAIAKDLDMTDELHEATVIRIASY